MYLLTISVNWPGSSFESKHKKAIKQKPKGERSKKTEHEQLLCLSSQRQAMIQLWHFYLGQLSHGGLLWLDHLLLACNYHYWLQIIHVGHLNYCQSTANWRAKSSTLFFFSKYFVTVRWRSCLTFHFQSYHRIIRGINCSVRTRQKNVDKCFFQPGSCK